MHAAANPPREDEGGPTTARGPWGARSKNALQAWRGPRIVLRRLVLLALLAPAVAGCLAPSEAITAASLPAGGIRVVDEAGAPIPYAVVTYLLGDAVVARGQTTLAFDRVLVAAKGYVRREVEASQLGEPVVLRAAEAVDPLDAAPVLSVLPPHTFDPYVFGPEAACGARNTCGLSEPVIEAAPGGVLYASGVCCVGGSPPVWVSRDAGASWQDLETPGTREAIGIEGDFAIDAAGNVYFTDILVGALWITSWDAEGNWRHTTPVFLPPLVDRPWVRAGAEDVVYFLYNTGRSTNFHVSTDGGQTFLPVPTKEFPAGLGTIGQGPEAEHLWVVAGGVLYESVDGGASWTEGEDVPRPSEDAGTFGFETVATDAAGNVAIAYDWGTEEDGYAIHVAVRDPSGAWTLRNVTRSPGTHVMPWIEAGPAGGFVVAWYGVDSEASGPEAVATDAPWHVYLATTHDAGAAWQTVRADPEPVLYGPMARRLLDFLQVDLDEAGAVHLVYAHARDGTPNELTAYARSTVGLGLPQGMPVAGERPSAQDPLSSYGGALLGPS